MMSRQCAATADVGIVFANNRSENDGMRPESPTGLYWSIRGDIACWDHAPAAADPRWTAEKWKPLVPVYASKSVRYRCKLCHGRVLNRSERHGGSLQPLE